jgi:hypothetical protein
MRILFFLFCIAAGAAGAYFTQPYASKNSDLILIIITVVTVFAGFLIAIITIIGDPILIPEGSWRTSESGRARMIQRLNLHVALFMLYLITVAFLFVGVVLDKALHDDSLWKIWIERSYLFFGITSFLLTFGLPSHLIELQTNRYDAETGRRRRRVGLPEDGNRAD